MTTTNETESSNPTTATTTATPAKTKLAAVKADTTKVTPDTAPTVNDAKATKPVTGKKATVGEASYLAIALRPELKARLDGIAQAEGVSTASVIRRAVLAQFSAQDQADDVTNGKVDQVQAGLDAVLGKLKQLDKAIDSALADTVRVADRLARATADKA